MGPAAGINRPARSCLTAPSALALYPVRVYAFFAEGVYRYDARTHKLVRVLEGDRRKLTGMQDFVFAAPLNLVYLADRTVYEGRNIPAEHVRYLCGQDAAGYAENVNLYTAGHGLRSSRAAAFPRRNCWRPSGWSRRAGSWRWAQTVGQIGLPAGREGDPAKGPPFFVSPMDRPDLSPRFGRRPPEGRLSDASGAARRPNPGLAATRCLLRNNATAARPSGPAGYGRVREQLQHLFARQEVHAQVLRRVETLFAERFDARGEVAVGEVVLCGGVGREGRQQTPLAAAVAVSSISSRCAASSGEASRRLGDAGREFHTRFRPARGGTGRSARTVRRG